MKNKVLNLLISIELYEQVKEIAERKGLSVASIVRLILSEFVEKERDKNNE